MERVSFQLDTSVVDHCCRLTFNSFPIYSITSISQAQNDRFLLYVGGGGGPSRSGIQNGFISIPIATDTGMPTEITKNSFCPTDDTVLGLESISPSEFLVAVGDNVIKATKEEDEFRISSPASADISLADDDFIRMMKSSDSKLYFILYSSGQIFIFINDKYEAINEKFGLDSLDDVRSIDVSGSMLAISTSTLVHLFPFNISDTQESIDVVQGRRQTIKVDPIKSIKIRSFCFGIRATAGYGYAIVNSTSNNISYIYSFLHRTNSDKWEPYQQLTLDKKSSAVQLAISSNGLIFAVGFSNGNISTYCARTLKLFYTYKNCHSLPMTSLKFVNYSQQLVSGSPDGLLNILSITPVPMDRVRITNGHLILISLLLIMIAILARIYFIQT